MSNTPEHVQNQILGMLKAGISEDDARSSIEKIGGRIVKVSSNGRLTSVLIEAADLDGALALLQQCGKFEALQLNIISKHC